VKGPNVENNERFVDCLDPDALSRTWAVLDNAFQIALRTIAPIDLAKESPIRTQFKDFELIRNSGQYQINKYAIIHLMSKPSITHPAKGMNGRGHVVNILDRVDSLPEIRAVFVEKDADLLSKARELCASLPYNLPKEAVAAKPTPGTDVD
jgi:hypothetical protein